MAALVAVMWGTIATTEKVQASPNAAATPHSTQKID